MSQLETMHERSFVESFILSVRRARLIQLLDRRRPKFLSLLDHGIGKLNDERFSEEVPSSWRASRIEARLRELGADESVYVFSTDPEIDGTEMTLIDAVERVRGSRMGSVISCVPGQLAYWEAEGPNDRVICHRK